MEAGPALRWPKPIGSPVLESLRPVIEQSRDVRTNLAKIIEHAGWLAYEELPYPGFTLPFGLDKDTGEALDFVMVSSCINFAFTDFSTGVVFQMEYDGTRWSDAQAMFACLKRAMDEGIPILDGTYLARVSREELAHVFRGNIEVPLLDERLAVFHQAGKVLQESYGGHFHNFVRSSPSRAYDNGDGLLERLIREFSRFHDVSRYDGHEVKFYKLGQLALWCLHSGLRKHGGFCLEDAEKLTAFADYIVPAALRVMGILEYSPALEQRINSRQLLPRDSTEEIEIRAHSLYATALLTEEINQRRPADLQIIIPQLDARLWLNYHKTHWPHHLTRTIMY